MQAVQIKWVAAALLALVATTSMAQGTGKPSLFDCGLRFGSASHSSKGKEYQSEKFRSDFQDVRPLPLQTETDQQDFSLQIKSDSGERRLVEVITLARFQCDLG